MIRLLDGAMALTVINDNDVGLADVDFPGDGTLPFADNQVLVVVGLVTQILEPATSLLLGAGLTLLGTRRCTGRHT